MFFSVIIGIFGYIIILLIKSNCFLIIILMNKIKKINIKFTCKIKDNYNNRYKTILKILSIYRINFL